MKITPKEINRNLLLNKSTELSEELSKGSLDPKELLIELNSTLKDENLTKGEKEYLSQIKRQLIFREFARSAIEQQEYRNPPGAKGKDSVEFKALREGKTGIPIVDAAVRELEETGKPHNRARLLIARYGTRNLNIDPEVIAFWFAEKFKDYDPALTTFNVTSAASGATFGEPYFRKSNPLTASKKLDPSGDYQKNWLPQNYSPKDKDVLKKEIDEGHQEWLKRWKENKPVSDWPRKSLYPTKDNIEGNYFIKDNLRAKSNFAHYYKKYKEKEEEFLNKAAYIKMKIREGKEPKNVPKIKVKKKDL